jgi:squalene synthase HpnC
LTTGSAIETPSGKGSGDENFPVGSWLLPAALRPHIALFYAFARAIDDIADNPNLSPEDKVARLDGFEAAITGRTTGGAGFEKADRLRRSLVETGVSPVHCVDLIAAFKQDATKLRYRDWDELIGYCDLSAAPVGRYLLDLHGESRDGYPASDALCNALQVINHLQDCKDDYLALDRVYLPLEWMEGAGVTVADLDAARASPGLRDVLDRALEGVEELLVAARGLPGHLKSRRLGLESSVIIRIAERLAGRLRRRDPVAERVELGLPAFLLCGITGVWRAVT